MNSCRPARRRWVLSVIATVAAAPVATAQAPTPAGTGTVTKAWHASGRLGVAELADNNVFLLSDAAKAHLDTLTTAAPPTTRFADMASASDYITRVAGNVGLEGPGLFGRTLSIRPSARYDVYPRNAKRSNTEFGLSIAQAFPRHGRLQLRGELIPSYFYRNFMADAIDLNGDRSIEPNERIYAAGTYRDSRIALGYRQRLVGATATQPFSAALEVEAGRIARTYDAPLAYRGYRGPVVAGTLSLGLSRAVRCDVGYTHAALNSKPDTAVLVLNEPDFNTDFNGDGTAVDLRVRTVQRVDFSRTEQRLELRVVADVAPGVAARAHYQHRWRSFPSTQPFDVYNNSRRDRRDFVGLELRLRVAPRADVSVGGDFETQTVTRSFVPSLTGEVTAYTRNRAYLGLRYGFSGPQSSASSSAGDPAGR